VNFFKHLNTYTNLILCVLAIGCICTGSFYSVYAGWQEGVCILVTQLLFVVLKASYSIFKDEQLKKIYKKNQDHESCVVLRGNTARTLKIWDLVVGDVVKLTQGDKVPMDSLVLSSNGLLVD
jgi:Ca2+-transporting ATPase